MVNPIPFWKPEEGREYTVRFLTPAPTYSQYYIDQRAAKSDLDRIVGVPNAAASWLDSEYQGEQYVMPGTSLPAYRYTFCSFSDQRTAKMIAAAAETKLRDRGYPVRAQTHLTKGQRDFYWKIEVFIPRQLLRNI